MALTSWKALRFFDTSPVFVPDPADARLFEQNELSAICTGSDNVFVGNYDGNVHIFSKAFKKTRSFKADEAGSITHLKQVEGTSLLVTIAEDTEYMSTDPTLKVWALDKLEKKTGTPRCQSTITIQNNKKRFPISAFAAVHDISQLAIGFANGSVTVVRGDLIHDRGTKQRTVFESEEPVTGIQFREGNTTALFIATTGRILTLVISGRGSGTPARTIDGKGCDIHCMTIDKSTRDVIVTREDAIYHYGLHGRTALYNVDGQKKLVATHKDYTALVAPSATNSTAKSTLAVTPADSSRAHVLLILNADFHFIALSENFPQEISRCFMEWGDFFILTSAGKIHRCHEKSLSDKLEMLYQRDLYVDAIQLAKKAGVSVQQQNAIFRRYGDYLYHNKKDYDTAMQQYLRAIDNTEPSQVIRKYLDTSRINNLVDYLEELHEHGKASSDHTSLLLNCYAKLKDVDKLDAFVKAPGDTSFDLDTAISMCRQGGYFDQAAYLARKHSEHDIVVSVLVEDSKKYAEALAYIWRLEPDSAFYNLSRYASVLLEHRPEETTQIFIEYYTGHFRPKKDAVIVTEVPVDQKSSAASYATSAVQSLASLIPLPYMNIDSSGKTASPDKKTETRVVESQSDEPAPKYDVPRPRGAFSAFLDHPDEFRRYLEACVTSEALKEEDKSDVYTTLFEMYLRIAQGKSGNDKAQWEEKAKELVDSKGIPMDPSNVLLLSDLENFKDGTTLVKEQQGLRLDIFRSYTSNNDTAGAIKALKRYGPEEPQLYPAALAYFTSSPKVLEEAGSEFQNVLHKIEDDRLMAPLQVIQTLSTNDVATMGLVKQYLTDTISWERDEISKNRKTISTFRSDTATKRGQLDSLATQPQTLKATRCAACGYALEQPSVHYMCEHSYHQRCLNVSEGESYESVECPKCAPQNANVRALKRAQEESKERHELFKRQLEGSKDRFGTVAEWFGRGVVGGEPVGS